MSPRIASLNRRDAETQRISEAEDSFFLSPSGFLPFLLSLCFCVSGLSLSCGSKPTDLRTLVPADTLVYLETNDLGAALQPTVKNDVATLKGVQLAIAVTGIGSSEEKLNADQSNAQVKPKFVAVADTHTWHFYAVRFAEEQLGAFLEKTYGSKPTIEEPDHPGGGRDIIWTAADGRKAYAFVIGSIVYFSNDRESLDKALAIRSGTASLASTGKVAGSASDVLASGYASTQGVAQIADVLGLNVAASAGDDTEVRSAVVAILPQLMREMVSEISWSAKRTDSGVTDSYDIRMPDSVVSALKDTESRDLGQRLRNTVVALLADSKLDPAKRAAVADAIVSSLALPQGSNTRFTASGLQFSTSTDKGLVSIIVSQLPGKS
jgi:hypothetical protein